MISRRKYRVAILGSGNIGMDLLFKVRRSKSLKCSYIVGRRADSPGLIRASSLGISALSGGFNELEAHLENIDLVFDATSAKDHLIHAPLLAERGVHVINLTPAPLGNYFVPNVTQILKLDSGAHNLNMVTCGGQTTIPPIHAITKVVHGIEEVEVVSTISSSSAGPATRRNLDEYIQNTETAIRQLTGIHNVKAMLVLNPAKPEVMMHTSVYISGKEINLNSIRKAVHQASENVSIYCPGYKISSEPTLIKGDIFHFSLSVTGTGDYLPPYSGNLDIINVAAINAAENLAGLRGE